MHIGLLELASDIKNSTAIMARTIDDQDISFCISKPWDRSYFPVICIEAAPLYPFPVGRCHLHDKGEKFDELVRVFLSANELGLLSFPSASGAAQSKNRSSDNSFLGWAVIVVTAQPLTACWRQLVNSEV